MGAGRRPQRSHVSYIPLRAKLALNVPAGEHVGLHVRRRVRAVALKRDYDLSDAGVTGSVGVRLGLGDVTSIRIDTYCDYIPSPDNLVGNNLNWGIQPGLSFLLGQPQHQGPRQGRGRRARRGGRVQEHPRRRQGRCQGLHHQGQRRRRRARRRRPCKDTPAGDKVDDKGCSLPKDADSDGVLDNVDQCPDTPAGDKVDAKGCSVPEGRRRRRRHGRRRPCKDTPAGDKVDAKGCSLPKDGDGDGVNDDKDRCPHTPAGVKVDEEGCQVLFEKAKKSLVLEGVNFATGKAELTPESQAILDGVAESLVANEEIKVQVGGHTDNTGSAAVNKRLSAARAEDGAPVSGLEGRRGRPADRGGLRSEQADRVEQDG